MDHCLIGTRSTTIKSMKKSLFTMHTHTKLQNNLINRHLQVCNSVAGEICTFSENALC